MFRMFVEYGLLVSLIAAAVIASAATLGTDTLNFFNSTGAAIRPFLFWRSRLNWSRTAILFSVS
jgi:hypothetical protein